LLTLCLLTVFLSFFNDPAPPEIYPLSLHDALPISESPRVVAAMQHGRGCRMHSDTLIPKPCNYLNAGRGYSEPEIASISMPDSRSEEHTSELQSLTNLVCRLLLEKKKTTALTPRYS